MRTERRVLVVTRHFWPSTTDQTWRLRSWVKQLKQQGFRPTVVTPRWHSTWPNQLSCEETPIVRIDAPPTSELRTNRYGRALTSWVSQELNELDFIYCDAASSDAHAILTQLPNNRVPVVVRFDPRELAKNASFPRIGRWHPSPKTMDVCRRATAIVVPNSFAHQQLLATGCDPALIHRIPDSMGVRVDRSVAARTAARMILANINHDLFVRSQDKVVVCPGELTRDWEIDLLIQALNPLLEEQRSLKLWILGDSIERSRIYDSLQYYGLHRIVVMPGAFTDVEQVLQAADLCVFPAVGCGLGWLLPTCIASSIPVVVADSPEVRSTFGELANQLCFRANDANELQLWIRRWLRNTKSLEQSVASAREMLVSQSLPGGASHTLASLLRARVLQPN